MNARATGESVGLLHDGRSPLKQTTLTGRWHLSGVRRMSLTKNVTKHFCTCVPVLANKKAQQILKFLALSQGGQQLKVAVPRPHRL